MNIQTLIIIILAVPILAAVVSFIRKGFSFTAFFSILFSTLILIGGIFLYMDTSDFQKNFSSSGKSFVLVKDDRLIAGFEGTLASEQEAPVFFKQDEISRFQDAYSRDSMAEIKGANYKLFIIPFEIFSMQSVSFNDEELSMEYVKSLFDSEHPIDEYIGRMISKQDIDTELIGMAEQKYRNEMNRLFQDDAQLKGALFALLFTEEIKKQGQAFLIKEYKAGAIKIYEETLLFRLIKILPSSLIDKLTQSVVSEPSATQEVKIIGKFYNEKEDETFEFTDSSRIIRTYKIWGLDSYTHQALTYSISNDVITMNYPLGVVEFYKIIDQNTLSSEDLFYKKVE